MILQKQQQQEQKSSDKLIYPHPKLLKYRFIWQNLRFLVINYYLFQAVLSSTFISFYHLSTHQLFPLNIVLLLFLGFDYIVKFCLTKIKKYPRKLRMYKLFIIYFCKTYRGIQLIILIIFYLSFILPYVAARWLRLIFMLRFLDIIQYNQEVYRRLELYPTAKKTYTIFKIMYLMLMFSHYFGCWFQLIDQALIQAEYYGPIAPQNLLYYQMNMLCLTPIQALNDWGRYLYGLYFLVSLITTIAFGDIIGKNPIQQIFVTIMMVVSTVIIALILEQFMNIVREDSLGVYQFVKVYNCLKTKMNDNQITLKTQNRVRSYLVFKQYQKKFHTHQPVVQKLSYRLQSELSSELYSHYIKQSFVINLRLFNNNQIASLANRVKIITFQAQTNIYEELSSMYEYPRCQLLYKLDGVVEERIICPYTKYQKKYSDNLVKKSQTKYIPLETGDKKIFNMANFLLNYRPVDDDYDRDQIFRMNIQSQQDQNSSYLNTISPPIQSQKYPQYLQSQNRVLQSIKISSFLILSLEDFQSYVDQMYNNQRIIKTILQIKQKIICKSFPLTLIGEYCSVCSLSKGPLSDYFQLYKKHGIINDLNKMNGFQHINEQCHRTHYVITQNQLYYDLRQSQNSTYSLPIKKMTEIVNGQKQQRINRYRRQGIKDRLSRMRSQSIRSRKSQFGSFYQKSISINRLSRNMKTSKKTQRNQIKSRKLRQVFNINIRQLINQQSQNQKQEEQVNIMKLFKKMVFKLESKNSIDADSAYDPQGIDLRYFINYQANN